MYTMAALEALKSHLLALHPGQFQDDAYLRSWFTPAVASLLIARGVVLRPERVVYGVGVPMRCHENALAYATLHDTATAYFGMGLYLHNGRWLWWGHSFCLEAGGSVIDSSAEPCAVYVGVEWREIYPLLPKSGAVNCCDLPPVLAPRKDLDENLSQGITTQHHSA